jgi:hypothetical protein
MTRYTINPNGGVIRDDGACVPEEPTNIDWQEYQDWLFAGNTADVPPPAPFDPFEVQRECGRRIYLNASDNAQKNMLANFVSGTLTPEDQQAFKDGTAWIRSMQETCRTLIATEDWDYTLDSKWPAVPEAAKNLAARF